LVPSEKGFLCEVRKAPPTRLEKEHFNESMKKAISKIRKEVL
jgi:hypothetical protein